MNFITKEQAQEAAKQGVIPAIECSLKHHRQGEEAGYKELINAIEAEKFSCSYEHCACCAVSNVTFGKTSGCVDCPLGDHFCGYNSVWIKVALALDDFKHDASRANHKAFQKAELDVCDYIEEVLAKEKAKSEKCELRHGDFRLPKAGKEYQLFVRDDKAVVRLCQAGGMFVGRASQWGVMSKDEGLSGNIQDYFDDLKRNSEDLEDFSVATQRGGDGSLQAMLLSNDIGIRLTLSGKSIYKSFTFAEVTEIHQKLGRIIATAKRKQK